MKTIIASTAAAVFSASLFCVSAHAGDAQPKSASGVGSYVPEGYSLVFNDEFNGTKLDRTKWATRYIYANGTLDRLINEAQVYRDNNNHVMHDGMLSLTARRVADGYESGMLRSKWEFKPTPTTSYYLEARARMPAGKGVWPAFWLNSGYTPTGRLNWGPEIDIFEFVVDGLYENPPTRPMNMVHHNVITHDGKIPSTTTYMDPNFQQQWNIYRANADLTADFHTYGLLWTSTEVSFYVDGVLTNTRTYSWIYDSDGAPAGPAHILLNLAIGGDWAGRYGIDDSAFPQALDLGWVRVYSKVTAR